MESKADYTLYVCTDRRLMSSATIQESVEEAIKGGATVIQLRDKEVSGREFYQTALALQEITSYYHVPLIINDRVDIAMAVDAAGVHLGQKDMPIEAARKLLGPDKIIGVSAARPQEAKDAQAAGADYLGVGAMFTTATKTDTRPVTKEIFREIRREIHLPIVAIGGVNEDNAMLLREMGADGIAVVSAVIAREDVAEAARRMKAVFVGQEGVK